MDQDFDTVYHTEQRICSIVIVLTALAIAIACLGLLGLAAYAAEQRSKEIGIRKILVATPGSIVALLSKDFTRLIVIALLIAVLTASLAMQQWLQNFAYRTTITPLLFVIAAATTLYQSLKAAIANPPKRSAPCSKKKRIQGMETGKGCRCNCRCDAPFKGKM